MRNLALLICGVTALLAAPLGAADPSPDLLARMKAADVVILGEVHDNPAHHAAQAQALSALQPRAVVWEMLTGVEAGRINAALIREPERLEEVLEWAESGWPPFAMYHPIFQAAPDARIYGGEVPRAAALAAIQSGPAVAFGADAELYGLTADLPAAESAERESLQREAHCNAIPEDRLAAMVDIQRLRDAVLAREVIAALDDTGGPVAVITGNGHARRDWGVPVFLDRVRPGLDIFALGQSEGGQIGGAFDAVIDAAPVDRGDPCDAFSRAGD
ncbi:ChaN family lipoprotein [Sedimentitalea sp. JM2-8]|uniref:ChaN family lipoprotein n=1 Tax=Sedimentitalea xiamensis TaxID=3050037 RepID=A0ABT7FBF4_9RHOB|nr:ChaN family lipoprotein [Sedimentitalea xiamensis]MDK3072179.1 ChaN family lipoprotein [Sedimentitalea xiamensis]